MTTTEVSSFSVTVSAQWHYVDTNTRHVAGYKGHRIEIAGYTAVVEEHILPSSGDSVFEFTVLKDHLEILEVGIRATLSQAKNSAQAVIESDIEEN